MGQLHSTCTALPRAILQAEHIRRVEARALLAEAAAHAGENHRRRPDCSGTFQVQGLKPGAFELCMVQLVQPHPLRHVLPPPFPRVLHAGLLQAKL
jgi:hypothetical protein